MAHHLLLSHERIPMANLPLYLFQILLLPDVSRYIFETLCLFFVRPAPRLEQGRHSDSSSAASASGFPSPPRYPPGGNASYTCPPSKLAKSEQVLQDRIAQNCIAHGTDEFTSHITSQSVTPTLTRWRPNSAQTIGPPGSGTLPRILPSQATRSNPSRHRDQSIVPQRSPSPLPSPQPIVEHPSSNSKESLTYPQPLLRQPLPYSQESQHMFGHARGFTVSGGTFTNSVDNSTTMLNTSNNFMKELLEKTILGAAFDSSARDPPPRCHPGTRLAILERCIDFIVNCNGERKMRWVVGAAGAGKSAIMQSVAESALPLVIWQASIFFFIKGRSDGSKAIVTLAYQLAAKCDIYRQFVEHEITRDPSLLHSSMSVQFNKFIVEPFIHHPQLNSAGRTLIIIDGLDECDKSHTQRELLRLISDFCLTYPSSPVVWMIASRPEPHIASFFAQASVEAAYDKEEILVDSDEGREDVERFLHIELTKIQHEFLLQLPVQWPSEKDFWKLAKASGGLFVYAYTVVKYVGDSEVGDPTLQLHDVLQIIDAHPLPNVPREEHPMAHLDALYSRILSKVPNKVRKNMRKLLFALVVGWKGDFDSEGKNFIVLCNWLGITYIEAYAAIRHLSSVLGVPGRDMAHKEGLRYYHKSFIDYISDYARSGFSPDIKHEAHKLYVQCTFKILLQAPDGIDVGDLDYHVRGGLPVGTLARGPGTGGNISLTWRVDEGMDWDDNKTKLYMYKMAFVRVGDGIRHGEEAFYTAFCLRLLVTRFQSFSEYSIRKLPEIVFDTSRRHELMERGLLQQIPVKALDFSQLTWFVTLRFCRPRTRNMNASDPWDALCIHLQQGELGDGKDQDWSTQFFMLIYAGMCSFCCNRLERQLERWKTQCPYHPVSVLFTSAGVSLVEFQFVDPEDGMSQWTYWLVHVFSEERRRTLGSIV